MGQRWKVTAVLIGVLLLILPARSDANLITYTNIAGGGRHNDVMVMEESGADVRELYSPTLYASGNAITPQQPDGTAWIAFMNETHDLYKIPADGLEPATKMLCHRGQYIGGDSGLHPYFLSGFPTWSPDGQNLLLLLIDEDTQAYFHALLDASARATTDCLSDLQPIPYEPQEPGYENDVGGWELIPSATWNDDGSKIAFLEAEYDANDWVVNFQLAILENGETGWTTLHIPVTPVDENVEVPWNLYRSNLDWQRGGDTLAFSQRTTSRTTPWLYWVDATTGDWGPMTIDGVAAEGHAPTWSPDGKTLMYSNAQFKLVTRPYRGSGQLGGPETTVGSGGFADWQRNPLLDCGSAPAVESACTDGLDNDCDGASDCGDPDCTSEPACMAPVCGDNYCDETEDPCTCQSDCGIPPGSELACSDGVDNDCDGASDCIDSDCFADPACAEVDCSQFTSKKPCNAELTCRWDNRNGICIDN